MTRPVLSLCMPVYNRRLSLHKQLVFFEEERLFDCKEVELVITDNASDDGTMDMIMEYSKKYPNIVYKKNIINLGAVTNIYKAFEISSGEYVWILGDDRLETGIFKEILKIINDNNPMHIFLNHSVIYNGKKEYDKICTLPSKFYENGLQMFKEIADNAENHLGALMFISSNIYKRKVIKECISIFKNINEEENLAIPLGFAVYSVKGNAYLFSEPVIEDDWDNVSWKQKSCLLRCRDMIAICEKMAKNIGYEENIRQIVHHNLPAKHPEYTYLLHGKKFGRDNYAMKWISKYYMKDLFLDLVRYIIDSIKK